MEEELELFGGGERGGREGGCEVETRMGVVEIADLEG